MPGKSSKIFSNPITKYLEAEGEIGGSEEQATSDPSATVHAIQKIITQEVGRIGLEIGKFREDVCKSMEALKHKVGGRLAVIVQKIEA